MTFFKKKIHLAFYIMDFPPVFSRFFIPRSRSSTVVGRRLYGSPPPPKLGLPSFLEILKLKKENDENRRKHRSRDLEWRRAWKAKYIKTTKENEDTHLHIDWRAVAPDIELWVLAMKYVKVEMKEGYFR